MATLPALALALCVTGLAMLGAGHAAAPTLAQPLATEMPTATATATPEPSAGLCTVTGRQTAGAQLVERGKTVEMRVELVADCPPEVRGRADILLVADNSGSMAELGKHEAAKEGVRQFVEGIDFERHRVGLVLFNESAHIAQPLTTRADRITRAFESAGRPSGGTDIASAIRMADGELSLRGRSEAVDIIVLMTDGISSEDAMIAAAEIARDRGTVIFSIGLGADVAEAPLILVASSPEHYYFAPGAEQLADIYAQIAAVIRTFAVTDVVLYDRLDRGMAYVPGSGRPDEPDDFNPLQWWRAFVSEQRSVQRYQVRVNRLGRVQPSAELWADYADGDGVRRRVNLVPAEVTVVEPEVHWVHLPIAWRNTCVPRKEWADIALAIDVSASMRGEKLDRAVAASKAFVRLLDLTHNQAAVISYAREAQVVQPLTGDLVALERALDGLEPSFGTRLDRGIARSLDELGSVRHRPANQAAIVLLSDGQQVEAAGDVYEWAAFARDVGVVIFTIALGDDADRTLLGAAAASPEHSYFAPDAAALDDIYARVAGVVRCR